MRNTERLPFTHWLNTHGFTRQKPRYDNPLVYKDDHGTQVLLFRALPHMMNRTPFSDLETMVRISFSLRGN